MTLGSPRYWITVLLLAGTLLAFRAGDARNPESLAMPLETLSDHLAGWTKTEEQPLPFDVLQVLKPDSYLSRTYRKGSRPLGLFVAYYALQRAGESMHSPKNCLPGSGWEISDYGSAEVPVGDRRLRVNQYAVQNGSRSLLVLYWYQSRTRIVASEYWGKIYLVRDALRDGATAGSLVRITLPNQPGALKDGIEFAAAVIPQVQSCLTAKR
jgi:EpsI family protein